MVVRIFSRFPHMGPMESKIWHRFLATTDLNFINIQYDVRVGVGVVPKEILDEYQKRMKYFKEGKLDIRYLKEYEAIIKSLTALTQLRIDAVAETENEIWIFEVKPRAGRSALGQLESYRYWYLIQYKPKKPVKQGVVCIDVDRNVEPIFRQKQIQIFIVKV